MPITYINAKRAFRLFKSVYSKIWLCPNFNRYCFGTGLSSLATVHEHLQTLEKKGVIRRFDGNVRGIELLRRLY